MSIAAALLAAAPDRVPALVKHGHGDAQVKQLLADYSAEELFPGARAPRGALAGLWLYFGCWEEAHAVSQDDPSVEGSYWHAIVHRQEPDAANANYWLRRVGRHPVHAALGEIYGNWDPAAFVTECGRARPGSAEEREARERQLTEWRLLYEYCKESA
ncbi:MAG: hypothetical protein K2X03_22755 [Bryobacteraceae bacterium]|nr:hypothetical protein [Bryobacteraceae bacterium]